MRKQTSVRLLALVLILAVSALVTHTVAHGHLNPLDEQHCQVCHIGQAAIPRPAVQTSVHAPVPIARFAVTERVAVDLEPVRTLSIPRAPPA
jgi:hypothetical protein